MISYIEYLNLPERIAIGIIALLLILNLFGEILEFKGKAVPEFMSIRKHISKKRNEKNETTKTLREVNKLLKEVNMHYSADNIEKRNAWMEWVNNRAEVYDNSIVSINKNLADVTKALQDNSKLTEEMFIQSSRDRIIDFATKATNGSAIVSREEFNRIFKIYDKYEDFLEDHGLTNGEVEIAIRIIRESYEEHMKKHSFLEDAHGYK